MDPLKLEEFYCPYCREVNSLWIDLSGGYHQQFIQDCEICCRPIRIVLKILREMVDIRADPEE